MAPVQMYHRLGGNKGLWRSKGSEKPFKAILASEESVLCANLLPGGSDNPSSCLPMTPKILNKGSAIQQSLQSVGCRRWRDCSQWMDGISRDRLAADDANGLPW